MSEEANYPNEIQRFYFEELSWCGCGNPEKALGFMRDVMLVMERRSKAACDGEGDYMDECAALDDLLPGALGLSYLYMLDALDLTEHGGSVGGSWLTSAGEGVLDMLRGVDLDTAMNEAGPSPTHTGGVDGDRNMGE